MAAITTRHGDDGTTSLLYGQRVPKHHPQIEAVGACDALTVALGAVRLSETLPSALDARIRTVQRDLIALMGEIACAEGDVARFLASRFPRLSTEDLSQLEQATSALESDRERADTTDGWAIPGDSPRSIAIEQARVAARLAERRVSRLAESGRKLRPEALCYLNRLSDFLWLLARSSEQAPESGTA